MEKHCNAGFLHIQESTSENYSKWTLSVHNLSWTWQLHTAFTLFHTYFFLPFLQLTGQVPSTEVPPTVEGEEEDDGMNDLNQEVMSLIWSEDLRVQEVRRLLQSSHPVRVNVVQMPEVSDHEYLEEKENR